MEADWANKIWILIVDGHAANESFYYKNSTFSVEKEWRILHWPRNNVREDEDKPLQLLGASNKPGYRVSGGSMISYIPVHFQPFIPRSAGAKGKPRPSSIVEVVLGTKNNSDHRVIQAFLHENEFKGAKVTRSSAPYR